jgi:hypothetical protein
MDDHPNRLIQPLSYRVWDPEQSSYFYTDIQPADWTFVDRWTGLFDREGSPLYENDIIRAHYDWRLGWVRALIKKHPTKQQYRAIAKAPEGTEFQIGFYCFAEAYLVGNIRQHPGRLLRAMEQFPEKESERWWLSRTVSSSIPSSGLN